MALRLCGVRPSTNLIVRADGYVPTCNMVMHTGTRHEDTTYPARWDEPSPGRYRDVWVGGEAEAYGISDNGRATVEHFDEGPEGEFPAWPSWKSL